MKYNDIRRKTRCVKIKDVIIGGNNDIAIQSMTNTDTLDKVSTLEQIKIVLIIASTCLQHGFVQLLSTSCLF